MSGVVIASERLVVFVANTVKQVFSMKDDHENDPAVKKVIFLVGKIASHPGLFPSVKKKELGARLIDHVAVKMDLSRSADQIRVVRLLDLSVRGALMNEKYIRKELPENVALDVLVKELGHLKTAQIEMLTKTTMVNIAARNPKLEPLLKDVTTIISSLQAKDGKHHDMVVLFLDRLKYEAKKFAELGIITVLEKEVSDLSRNTPHEAACVPLIYSVINLSYCIHRPVKPYFPASE